MIEVPGPIDFGERRVSELGRRAQRLRQANATRKQTGARVRRQSEIQRLKALPMLQYAATLCRASDELLARWPSLARRQAIQGTWPRDELLARRVRARLRQRGSLGR